MEAKMIRRLHKEFSDFAKKWNENRAYYMSKIKAYGASASGASDASITDELHYRIGIQENKLNVIYVHLFNLQAPFSGEYVFELVYTTYGIKPPTISFLTSSGRFEIKKPICLNISSFHPETWSPTLTIDKVIMSVISSMYDKDITGLAIIKYDENIITTASNNLKEVLSVLERLNLSWIDTQQTE
jgi:ubiquitin-protein ligase